MDSILRLAIYLVIFIMCLIASAFFSAAETAFIGLQRIRVEHLVRQNVKGAKRVLRMVAQPPRLLSTILLGSNFFNVAVASLGTLIAVSIWGEKGVLISTIVVTGLVLVFGETTPKTVATQHTEGMAFRFAAAIDTMSWWFTPIVVILSWIASGFAKLVGGKPIPKSLVSEEEIETMIVLGHREGTVDASKAGMLHRVFDFGDRLVREVMVPRAEVVAVPASAPLSDFLAIYAEHPISRYPVFRGNRDNVVGILAIKDVLMAQAKGTLSADSPIEKLARPAYFAPETKPADELFAEMRDNNYHVCVVVDEFGGTAGIVTLDMLAEQIVGPVGDELRTGSKDYEIIDEYTFQIDGSMRVAEANEKMGLGLPEGDYETVAGFVLHLLGRIPRPNEQLRYKDLKLVITEMRGNKIEKILLTRGKPAESSSVPSKTTARKPDA